MTQLLLKIEYDGTNFHGWQRQPNVPTIQENIEQALQILFKQSIKIRGASRTDSGVHAKEQMATIDTPYTMPSKKLLNALNALTHRDISILEFSFVSENFCPIKNNCGKQYSYFIRSGISPKALFQNYCWFMPQKLNHQRMKTAALSLIGTYDFQSFRSKNCSILNTIKTIHKIDWEIDSSQNFDDIKITFIGSGFLRNMIRILVGSLVEIGLKKKEIDLFKQVLKNGKRSQLGKTAPSKGLFLEKILFPPSIIEKIAPQ